MANPLLSESRNDPGPFQLAGKHNRHEMPASPTMPCESKPEQQSDASHVNDGAVISAKAPKALSRRRRIR